VLNVIMKMDSKWILSPVGARHPSARVAREMHAKIPAEDEEAANKGFYWGLRARHVLVINARSNQVSDGNQSPRVKV